MNEQDSRVFWLRHYHHCKDILDRIRDGEKIPPKSIQAHEIGVEAEAIKEANYAIEKLEALGIKIQKIQ